jgi:hypothetical protein
MSRHSFSWIQGTLLAALASVVLCGLPDAVVAAEPTGSAAAVQQVMDTSGVDRGVCCVLGFDAEAALKLVRTGDFLIHLLDPDPEVVAQVRQMADQAGLDIDRVVAEQGGLDELPQADNIVDLLVATKITDDDLTRLHVDETSQTTPTRCSSMAR